MEDEQNPHKHSEIQEGVRDTSAICTKVHTKLLLNPKACFHLLVGVKELN